MPVVAISCGFKSISCIKNSSNLNKGSSYFLYYLKHRRNYPRPARKQGRFHFPTRFFIFLSSLNTKVISLPYNTHIILQNKYTLHHFDIQSPMLTNTLPIPHLFQHFLQSGLCPPIDQTQIFRLVFHPFNITFTFSVIIFPNNIFPLICQRKIMKFFPYIIRPLYREQAYWDFDSIQLICKTTPDSPG